MLFDNEVVAVSFTSPKLRSGQKFLPGGNVHQTATEPAETLQVGNAADCRLMSSLGWPSRSVRPQHLACSVQLAFFSTPSSTIAWYVTDSFMFCTIPAIDESRILNADRAYDRFPSFPKSSCHLCNICIAASGVTLFKSSFRNSSISG